MRWWCSVLALVALFCTRSSAHAEALALTWRAPPGCPSEADVRQAIVRTVEAGADTAGTAVAAHVARVDGQYRLDLTIHTRHANVRKALAATHCATLVEVIALQLGIAFSASPGFENKQDAAARELGWSVRATGGVGTGPTPTPSPRVAVAGALRVRGLRVELGALYDTPRSTYYVDPSTVGGKLDMLGAQARLCHAVPRSFVALPLCGGVEAGILRGAGIGVEPTGSAQRAWAALLLAVALRVPRESIWGAWVELESSLALKRPTFGIRELPALYRADRVTFRGAAGIDVQFD